VRIVTLPGTRLFFVVFAAPVAVAYTFIFYDLSRGQKRQLA
jgi:hypothetical protein